MSKVVLDNFEPVSIFYEIDKTICGMYERQKLFEVGLDHYRAKDLEYCNYLPKVDFLQVFEDKHYDYSGFNYAYSLCESSIRNGL